MNARKGSKRGGQRSPVRRHAASSVMCGLSRSSPWRKSGMRSADSGCGAGARRHRGGVGRNRAEAQALAPGDGSGATLETRRTLRVRRMQLALRDFTLSSVVTRPLAGSWASRFLSVIGVRAMLHRVCDCVIEPATGVSSALPWLPLAVSQNSGLHAAIGTSQSPASAPACGNRSGILSARARAEVRYSAATRVPHVAACRPSACCGACRSQRAARAAYRGHAARPRAD